MKISAWQKNGNNNVNFKLHNIYINIQYQQHEQNNEDTMTMLKRKMMNLILKFSGKRKLFKRRVSPHSWKYLMQHPTSMRSVFTFRSSLIKCFWHFQYRFLPYTNTGAYVQLHVGHRVRCCCVCCARCWECRSKALNARLILCLFKANCILLLLRMRHFRL